MTRDRRRLVWVLESCPRSKPPLKRIWKAEKGVCFSTRAQANKWIREWLYDGKSPAPDLLYLYRASCYGPVQN